jgi:CubicO group peptidase (beta-lactamase class C family)
MGTTRWACWLLAAVLVLVGCTTATPVDPAPPPPTTAPADRLAQRIDAFLGASKWGRYDRVTAVVVSVDGRPVVQRQTRQPEPRAEVSGVSAAVLVALVGILLERSADPATPEAGRLGTAGVRGVHRPLAELLPGPLPAELAPSGATPLHDLLVGTSLTPTAPLTAVLVAATGRPVPDLAREWLFGPLGIDPPWTPDGPAVTAGETATLAALWLDRGTAGGRQVVPAAWLDLAGRPYAETGLRRLPYAGYHQWVTRAGEYAATVFTGQDGQLVEVVPGLGLVVVVACGEDPNPDVAIPAGSESFVELVSSTILPALG